MEIQLTISDRLVLIGLLDNVASSRAKRKIIEDKIHELSLSVEEVAISNYHESTIDNKLNFSYQSDKDPMKKIDFDDIVLIPIIVNLLEDLDKKEQITKLHTRLCAIFLKEEKK